MHADGSDCLLVVEHGHLVGIFTDRDAVVKAAGKRLEDFDGLVILTTNNPESLDQAFMRRIRFKAHFPAPEVAERERPRTCAACSWVMPNSLSRR